MLTTRLNLSLMQTFSVATALALMVWGSFAFAGRSFGPHEGYLSTTEGERESQVKDMVLVQPPLDEGPTLRERIFNDKLSKEFKDAYEEKFGRTEVERVYNSPNRTTYYNDVYGLKGTPQDINDERQRFGDFMIRRLTEYHVDNYLNNDPKMRPVLEAKERLSNVQVQVAQFRVDMNYSIAGNTLDVKAVNPWLSTSRVRLQMSGFGIGAVQEAIVSLGRELTPAIFVESHYYTQDGIVSLIGRRMLTANLATTFTTSTFTKDAGKTRRESVYLAGVSYVF